MDTQKPILLVVDDDPKLRLAYSRICRRAFRVVEAEGVQAALQQVWRHNPDLILCDLMMPDGMGTELHEALAGTRWASRFVFNTGWCKEEQLAYIRDRGLPLLEKPVQPTRLREVLAAVYEVISS